MTSGWSEFYKASLQRPLHPLWDHINPHLRGGQTAVDLGCGVGSGTLHLLQRGLKVTALDTEPEALEILRGRLPDGCDARLELGPFESFPIEAESLDLIVAFFSIFFMPRAEFSNAWPKVIASLKPGGVFAGQLLGTDDDWAARDYTSFDRAQIEELLEPFEGLYFEEVNRDGETILRQPKHWHIFHIVARKRG